MRVSIQPTLAALDIIILVLFELFAFRSIVGCFMFESLYVSFHVDFMGLI